MFEIEKLLVDKGCRYERNALLSNYTTFRTGGSADYVVFPDSVDVLREIVMTLNSKSIPYYVLGKGSNVLALDEGYKGVVICTCDLKDIRLIEDDIIECECGLPLIIACRFALEHSLSGLEFAYGIPGSCGGAVFMNAGAYDGEMKDIIVSVKHLTPQGKIETLSCDELGLSYRSSVYANNDCIVLSVLLKLKKSDSFLVKSKMDELMQKRKEKQPLEYPSAGSTFKRPVGYFAGALIQECGLMGYSIGGAMVSKKHAGFIINYDNASSGDILNLIKHCHDTVLSCKGVELEPEVRILK